jgi:hypothetical protein
MQVTRDAAAVADKIKYFRSKLERSRLYVVAEPVNKASQQSDQRNTQEDEEDLEKTVAWIEGKITRIKLRSQP